MSVVWKVAIVILGAGVGAGAAYLMRCAGGT
jgi:hypothetical protein